MDDSNVQPFDPVRHLTRVDGREYLPVKFRLVWLRDQHPDSEVDTELVAHQNGAAVFRCRAIKVSANGTVIGKATGWAMRNLQDDGPDYLEKCETAAIGRALAHLGYGTQFVTDDEGAIGRPVDAPVRRERGPAQPGPAQPGSVRAMNGQQGGPVEMATPGQVKFMYDLFTKLQYDPMGRAARLLQDYGVEAPEQLTKRQAMELIPILQAESGG